MSDYLIKLVRDRVEESFVHDRHEVVFEDIEEREEHARLLRQKLLEEAGEYLMDPSLGELADVLEVVLALCVVDLRKQPTELREACDLKRGRRGGFHNGRAMYAREVPNGTED